MKIKNLFKGEGFVNFSSSILAIVCGLLFGLIILLISNPSQAFGGFMMIIQGGFTDGMQGFGQVLYMATPLIMTGLSVGLHLRPDCLISERPDSLQPVRLQRYMWESNSHFSRREFIVWRHFWQRFWQERSGAWFLDF